MDTMYPIRRGGPVGLVPERKKGRTRSTKDRGVQPQDSKSLMMFIVLYRNGRRGRIQADIALETGVEKEADVVVIAEVVESSKRRNQHGAYNVVTNMAYLAVYIRKDRQISCKKRGGEKWVLIGDSLAAAYLPPQTDGYALTRAPGQMVGAEMIIGDLNASEGTKSRKPDEFMEEHELGDIETTQHTRGEGTQLQDRPGPHQGESKTMAGSA